MAERARTPGPLARFFSGLANALLDLGLPRIRAWLRERIGEGATVDDAYTEGSYLHLRGVRIPLGPRGRLVLSEATVALAGKRAADLPELRLHAFRGKVAFGEGDLEADIVFTAVPDPDARAWVAGDLRITDAVWSGSTRDAPRRGPMNGSARLFVTSDEASLEDGRLESPNADVRFTAEATPDPPALRRATVDLPKARVGAFVDAVRSILGRALEIPPGVPPDAGLDGRLTWDERAGGTCKLHTSTDGLRATVEGAVDADGKNLQGRIVAEVAPALPMYAMRLPAALVPRDEDVLSIALDLGGDVKRPVVTGTVTGPQVGFRFGRPRFHPILALADVHADVAIADDVARVKLRTRASSGSIQASLDWPLRVDVGRRISARLDGIEAIWLAAIVRALGVRALTLEGDAGGSDDDERPVFALPRDAKTSAVLSYEHGADGPTATATVKAHTASSHLAIEPVAIVGDRITGGRLHGSLDVAEALRIGLFPFAVRPAAEGAIVVDLALEGPLRAPIARGHLASPRIVLEVASRPTLAPIPCTDVDVRVVATKGGATLDPVRFRALGGSFRLDARLGVDFGHDTPLLAVHAKDADAAFLERAASFAREHVVVTAERPGERPRGERWIPASSRLSGTLTLARDRSIASELLLVSDEGTRMAATLDFGPAAKLRAIRLRGPVALADVRLLGAFDASPVSIVTEGVVHADVVIAPNEPVSGFVFAERLALSTSDDADAPRYAATDVLVPFRADGAAVVWRDASATLYGGRAMATGASFADGSLHASIRVQDARIEQVPRTRTESLASVVRGRLGVELDLVKRPGAAAPAGRGWIALHDPAYAVLALAAGALRRYGLPAPEEIGTEPATAELALDARGVALRHVRAAVPGIQADGDITIRTAPGVADGAFVVTLGERYLRSSPLLSLPGAIAETLTLPVRIGGPLATPKVDADLATCLGRFVTENRVTDIVTDAAEGVVSLFTGREPPPPPEVVHAPAPPPERAPRAPDPVLERAVGPASAWEPIERRILESGLSTAPRSRYRVV